MKTYQEVYFDRIDKAKTDEEIKVAYQAMLDENEGSAELVNQNLGYILGYYDSATREPWYRLFNDVVHPIFGQGFGRGNDSTLEEAFEKGKILIS